MLLKAVLFKFKKSSTEFQELLTTLLYLFNFNLSYTRVQNQAMEESTTVLCQLYLSAKLLHSEKDLTLETDFQSLLLQMILGLWYSFGSSGSSCNIGCNFRIFSIYSFGTSYSIGCTLTDL